jgi:hypothetical protein
MPSVRLAVLSLCALALAACLRPVEQRRAHDTGVARPDGGTDAGEVESADGSCLTCLPDCAPTCTNGDAGCPFIPQPMHDLGCPASAFSLVRNGVTTDLSFCACAEVWLAQSENDLKTERRLGGDCARTQLRRDSKGQLHLLVEDRSGGLILWEQGANGWQSEVPPQIGPPAALALDSSGATHLAGLAQEALLHLKRVDKKWQSEGAAPAKLAQGSLLYLALGPDDLPRIAFSEGDVRLATRTASGWQLSVVVPSGAPVSLQVDPQGRPHLLYFAEGLGVRYAFRTDEWKFEALDSRASAGSLALGPLGCPRAAWSSDHPYYGERTADGWRVVQVAEDEGADLLDEPLALDGDGRPFVAHGKANLEVSAR